MSLHYSEAHMTFLTISTSLFGDLRWVRRAQMATSTLGAVLLLWLIDTVPAPAALTSPTDRCFGPCAPLFGTREMIGHNLTRFHEWQAVMTRSQAELATTHDICARGQNGDCVPAQWTALLAALKGQPLRRQIEIANDGLNRVRYVPTVQNWHRAMYWETPFEFLRYGGQCQDYAIAKYELLRQAGVPASAMRMVVLRDTAIARDHAVLVVYVEGEPLVLDILNPAIVPADTSLPYRPYYSINENAWWYHLGPHSMEGWMVARAR
jgi:predicted transglutaminase-like cysteine proteinase